MSLLLAVAERGSLSAASRALGVPVATLSRKVSDLEARLSTRLLIRTTRKLSLTDSGSTFVAAAKRILDQLEEAEREAAGEFTAPRGELVLTAPILFGRLHVLPVVADFLAEFPEINVRLVLSDGTLDLVDNHVDMAVRIGALQDSSMIATRIGAMRTVVCASPLFLERHGTPETPEDLRRMPCLALDRPSPPPWRFRRPDSLVAMEVPIAPRLSVSTAEAIVDSAVSHVGVARLLHYQVAGAVAAGHLRVVLDAFEMSPAPVHLVHAARGQMPLKMRRFIDAAAPRLRAVLSNL